MRQSRSDQYQYKILEIPCDHDWLSWASNGNSLASALDPFTYDEAVLELEDQLTQEVMRVCEQSLTPSQHKILMLTLDGYTQMEIAKMLGINQSSVCKTLNGNQDYRDKKRYGGIQKKLKKLCLSEPKIISLLNEISELKNERL